MTIQLNHLIAGVQNKTACVMAIARQDGQEIQVLNKRITELAGLVELLGHAEHPHYQAIGWIRRYQNALASERMDCEDQ